ncbi:DegT/DnrJ/EryC1/StrS family aminotransferase [Paremcibacter congregatus]|uniref:DegT/DnrJ/EryC1/StrS family aminotransferase n=1 Tax=Paremcibacter congregatus TaxID=2043170 RepID=UPI003A91FD14
MQFIDLQKQYKHLKTRIDKRIQTVLDHGKYILGPEVKELEERLSDFVGVKHSIGVANGTDALQLALMALDVGPGDAVFTTTFTFFATAEVISLVGAHPVFVDIDAQTYNIDPDLLDKAIERVATEGKYAPKAVISVDLFGLPADYDAISAIAGKHGLKIIEDAAQGFGGSINGKMAGSFGDIATTSFFPAKPLGCYGDGGAVFTNNDELAEKVISLRVHGKGVDKYDNIRIGLNSRLDTIQAAILLEKLAEFPREMELRQSVAGRYDAALHNQFHIPFVPDGYVSSWAQYTIRPIKGPREGYMTQLKESSIPTTVYYGKNMHEQTAFSFLNHQCDSFPIADEISRAVFSLPMHPYLDYLEQCEVSSILTRDKINFGSTSEK